MADDRPDGAAAVERAVEALAAGQMIVVTDDVNREDEGDIILPASAATAETIAFVVRHTTGILCAPMPGDRADVLALPPMIAINRDPHGTAFTVSVDHESCGTGVSASDRAATLRSLADPSTQPHALRRPGHIFPLRARDGGVHVRAGHTEAAVDLLRLAGREPVGVIGEIVGPQGEMARGELLRRFAGSHRLPIIAIADLIQYRRRHDPLVERVASSLMPTTFGDFKAVAYRSKGDGTEHLALVHGDIGAANASERGTLVRVHSECLTGDIVASLRCDCGAQLERSMQAIVAEGAGAIVYLRGHEGRGIGLAHKICAYALQDAGLDTVDANTAQGLAVDSRSYDVGAAIIDDLGIERLRLLTNNPAKYSQLRECGIQLVGRVELVTLETPQNRRYLRTKKERMGHLLALDDNAV